jgi:hypothetical protein
MKKFALMILVTFGALAAHAACTEGSTTTVKVPADAQEGDYYELQTRTCVNGSYMNAQERAAYVKNPSPIVCAEGSTQAFYEYNTKEDRVELVVRTCVNGRFFPKAAPTKAYRCVEGTLNSNSVYDATLDHNITIVTKCVGGKHVEIRRW